MAHHEKDPANERNKQVTAHFDPKRDLRISRTIRAEPSAIWRAWTDPSSFEKWWVPAPARCKVLEMDLRPGGALTTHISEGDTSFAPHLDACFLEVVENQRIVFTNALVKGWRPALEPFMTAVIELKRHPRGTEYTALVMHKDSEQRDRHEQLGFNDGWGTVIGQLAQLVEGEPTGKAGPP